MACGMMWFGFVYVCFSSGSPYSLDLFLPKFKLKTVAVVAAANHTLPIVRSKLNIFSTLTSLRILFLFCRCFSYIGNGSD